MRQKDKQTFPLDIFAHKNRPATITTKKTNRPETISAKARKWEGVRRHQQVSKGGRPQRPKEASPWAASTRQGYVCFGTKTPSMRRRLNRISDAIEPTKVGHPPAPQWYLLTTRPADAAPANTLLLCYFVLNFNVFRSEMGVLVHTRHTNR